MSSPPTRDAKLPSSVSAAKGRANAARSQGVSLTSYLEGASNRTVHDLIGLGGPIDRAGAGNYAFGSGIASVPEQSGFDTADRLSPQEDQLVDQFADAVPIESRRVRLMVAAAIRGFLIESRAQLFKQGKAEQIRQRLDALSQPSSVAAFV